jgi:hypothetical protein
MPSAALSRLLVLFNSCSTNAKMIGDDLEKMKPAWRILAYANYGIEDVLVENQLSPLVSKCSQLVCLDLYQVDRSSFRPIPRTPSEVAIEAERSATR